jgi:hypothetical protein
MSIGTISDVLTRISGIEQQMQSLQSGALLDSQLGIGGGSTTSTSDSTPASSSSAAADPSSTSDFANELAAAEQGDSGGTTADASSMLDDTAAASGSTFGSLDSSALGSSSYASGALGSSSYDTGLLTGAGTSGVALSSSASSQLTSGQQQFASTLSAETGLNPNVVSSWLLAEESGGAAQSRQAAGNNDWLNIGYTDSGTYGSSDSVWSDPTTAANATAAWLQGQDSIPGYGTASSGIQSILSSVGQTPAAQIQAIQSSGWSSGGYPSLDSLYQDVTGGSAT